MNFTSPPAVPQRNDRLTFSDRMDAFLRWLVTFFSELVGFQSNLNAIAAGGAYSIPYSVDIASTADADPGAGVLRFNSSTQNGATTLYLDLLGADGIDYTTMLDQLDASNSAVKGQIRLIKMGEPLKFLLFDVTARTTATGYRKLTVVNRGGGGAASPFVAGDGVLLQFTRAGDAATPIVPAYNYIAGGTFSTTVATIDFLNIFTTGYDKYVIELSNWDISANAVPQIQLAVGGAVQNGSVYSNIMGHGGASNVGATAGALTSQSVSSATGGLPQFTIEVGNANTPSSGRRNINVRGSYFEPVNNQSSAVSGSVITSGISTLSGFRLLLSTGSFTRAKVAVYGIRNSA